MKHNMQEMTAEELETACGGVSFQEAGEALGAALDALIVAVKKIGSGLAELFASLRGFFG